MNNVPSIKDTGLLFIPNRFTLGQTGSMKKRIYITLFVFLGVLLQFLAHSGVEIVYIGLLRSNFETWSFGLSWADWWTVHVIMTVIFLILGMAAGFWAGKYFWQKIYGSRTFRHS